MIECVIGDRSIGAARCSLTAAALLAHGRGEAAVAAVLVEVRLAARVAHVAARQHRTAMHRAVQLPAVVRRHALAAPDASFVRLG